MAAAGSPSGASRAIFDRSTENSWTLVTTQYVLNETFRNFAKLPPTAIKHWPALRRVLQVNEDIITLDRPALFDAAKDRPILFSAFAWAEVLLTLDRNDFERLLGGEFYGMPILTPATFLELQRSAGKLK